jgi:hypothetical protein
MHVSLFILCFIHFKRCLWIDLIGMGLIRRISSKTASTSISRRIVYSHPAEAISNRKEKTAVKLTECRQFVFVDVVHFHPYTIKNASWSGYQKHKECCIHRGANHSPKEADARAPRDSAVSGKASYGHTHAQKWKQATKKGKNGNKQEQKGHMQRMATNTSIEVATATASGSVPSSSWTGWGRGEHAQTGVRSTCIVPPWPATAAETKHGRPTPSNRFNTCVIEWRAALLLLRHA